MSEKVNEAFNNLRLGFKFSLITVILIISYAILCLKDFFVYLLFPFGLPFFLLLFTWAYGLIKRHVGWSLLNQRRITKALSFGGIMLFIFLFLPATSWIYPIIYHSDLSLFSIPIYATILIPPIAWGIYTWMENRGFRRLKQNYGINLASARICNLIGILVYYSTYVVLYLLAYSHIYFDFIPYFYVPISPFLIVSFLFASPFLIASCIFAIIELGAERNGEKK